MTLDRILLAAAIAFLLAACSSSPARREAPSSESSWKPPVSVAGLALETTEVYPQPEYGTKYTYGIKEGQPIDLFIYPIAYRHELGSEEGLRHALAMLREEYLGTMQQAVKQGIYGEATGIEEGSVRVVFGGQCLEGIYQRHIISVRGERYTSDMYGFAAYGHYLKFRISRPIAAYSAQANERFVQEAMAATEQSPVIYIDPEAGQEQMSQMLLMQVLQSVKGVPHDCAAAPAGGVG